MQPQTVECNAAKPVKCRPLLAAACLLAVLCLAQGCDRAGSGPSASADPPVALIEAGAEPRRPLRHEATPGALCLAFTIAKAEVAGQGSDTARLREIESDLALQNPAGITGGLTRSSRGHVRALDLEILRGARPTLRNYFGNLRQAFFELAVPLPEEAIGAGARWRAVQTVEMAGLKVTQSAEYCLQTLAGDEATVEMDALLLAEPQTFPLPDLPPGARCELVAFEGTARGELVLDLKRALPAAGELRCVLDMRLAIHDPNSGPAQAASHLEMKFTVER
ncbi:MAG: hypothetical protein HY812_15060 [Planctomycetes bacterium]|nr:hypothetical protein [Planctomycetota bacterium]